MNMLVTRVMLVIKTKAMILMTCLHPPPCPASDHISTPAAPEMMSLQPSQPATMSITNWIWEGATIKIMSKYRFTWTPGLRLGKGEWDGEEVYVSEFDIFKKNFNWWEWLVLSGPLTQGGLKVFHSVPAVAVGIWRGSSGSRVQGADQGRDPTKMVNGKFFCYIQTRGGTIWRKICNRLVIA